MLDTRYIKKWVGAVEPGTEKPFIKKALVKWGTHQAWVIARGATHEEALQRMAELIDAQVHEWMGRDG